MANVGPTVWYARNTGTLGWAAMTPWAAATVKAAGALVRQLATPTAGNERAWVCIVAGTTHATTEPTWTFTKGVKITDNTVTWQECTGQPGVNGDLTNTPTWTQNKNRAISLGLIVQPASGGSLQICSTAGTTGNVAEPAFSNTAGVTTADNTVTWTSLGAPASFGNWAAPAARASINQATNWMTATDTQFIGLDHAETWTSVTYTTVGYNYSVPTATIPPTTPTAGASISLPTGNGTLININGTGYWYGVKFSVGSGATNGTWSMNGELVLDTCALEKLGTGSNNVFTNTSNNSIYLNNTTMKFGSTSDSWQIQAAASIIWRNTASALLGTIPSTFLNISAPLGRVLIEGVDLSAITGTIVPAGPTQTACTVVLNNCKINAAATISVASNNAGPYVHAVRCGSAAHAYYLFKSLKTGTQTQETTIVRTGGDPTSWKIVTSASSQWTIPFECFPISIRNEKAGTSNVTLTVYGIWGGAAVPNNDDIWMDVLYMGDAASPQGTFNSLTKASGIATPTALSSDSSTWGGSTTPFKMVVTLSSPQPQIAGYMHVYVRAAKASTTFYIDPTVRLT